MQPTVSGTAMMTMEPITSEQALHERIAASALLVLFGGAHCGVCQAIRPRIESMVLRFYLGGQLALERGRSFSLQEVGVEMERVLGLFSF